MDFAGLVLFLIFYYVRPHEWVPGLHSLHFPAMSLLFAMAATLLRERGFSWRDLVRTPHDWLMLLFFAWIILTSNSILAAWKEMYPFLVYYLVTVQALYRTDRLQRFLNWWTGLILLVVLLALDGEFGFDIVGSYDITHGIMKDRLVLGTSIFDNPNYLGHSVVPVLVMIYFICIWKRPFFLKIGGALLLLLPMFCIYLTESKGSYLAGFTAVLVALVFNRPRMVQIMVLFFALTAGWTAVQLLPRMNELNTTKKDEAIQGRVAAFQFGLKSMQQHRYGLGYGRFSEEFDKVNHYAKTAHCTYVEIGAEAGRIGLLLYLGILYCCFRTLVTCRTNDIAQERVRRILFVLLATFAVSSWMAAFAYRATFFLMVGATAAFHRQLAGLAVFARARRWTQPGTSPDPQLPTPGWQPGYALGGGNPAPGVQQMTVVPPTEPAGGDAIQVDGPGLGPTEPAIRWNRLGWVDLVLIVLSFYFVQQLWVYLIQKMGHPGS